jgi:hypothetical protein
VSPPAATRARPRATSAARAGAAAAAILAALGAWAPAGRAGADEADGPRRYGDAGGKELSVGLGVGSGGFAAAAGFRYFVVDRVAPGIEAGYASSGGRHVTQVFASLRVVPLRAGPVALVITGRGGRLFLSGHADGWGLGGDAGLLLFLSPHAGIELGYEILRLLPASFCADLTACTLHGPVLGLRLAF